MTVLERFLKYVKIETTSDEASGLTPSTACQKDLGAVLVEEMKEMGLEEPHMDESGYVYGWLPATPGYEAEPVIGLIAHMDTSPAVSGKGVCPQILSFTGEDLALGNGVVLSPKDYPNLMDYVGKDLIVTDGSTLLGADDKAGVAEILALCDLLLQHPELPHGRVAVGFTPDEEIGSGADRFDIEKFGAAFAYTVDGGELGEIEYENFNGAAVDIVVTGLNIHPGSAKNKMKNALLLANELISMLPPAETPAHTEGYEGFYHLCALAGDESEAEMHIIIRDHDREKFEARKCFMQNLINYLNGKYDGAFVLNMQDSYYNMKEKILPHMHIIERAERAMRESGVSPKVCAIRGGTDGARLSFEGLPCPNLSTGGANFHGIHEFIPVFALEKMVEVLRNLIVLTNKSQEI